MPVTLYRSTDSGAPNLLIESADSLIAILDACLVSGYGTQSAAGWTKTFTDTHKAVYRMNITAPATGFYLRVDDASTDYARLIGYESMSDVDTGVNPFPTSTQLSGGLYIKKSNTNPGWLLLADSRAFYLYYYNVPIGAWYGFFFGDIYSQVPSDAYGCAIVGRINNVDTYAFDYINSVNVNLSDTPAGHWLARNYSSAQLSQPCLKYGKTSSSMMGDAGFVYPNPSDSGLLMDRMLLVETTPSRVLRGSMPGLWNPLHPAFANHGDTFGGTGDLAGRTFLLVNTFGGRTILETSDTWRS